MPMRTEVNCLTGEVVELELTQAEIDEISARPRPTGPTPLEQIRAIEAAKADAMTRVTRQTLLLLLVDKEMSKPENVAALQNTPLWVVRAKVTDTLIKRDAGFKSLYDVEVEVDAIRQVVQPKDTR